MCRCTPTKRTPFCGAPGCEWPKGAPASTTVIAKPLSSAAVDVLGQLFTTGPTWDGNVVSKTGRSELVAAGLAFRDNGWTSLSAEGVRLAAGWNPNALRFRHDQRWYCKIKRS